MAREFFKDLPNTTTPLTASRLNGLLNGDEALGSIVVDDVSGKNLFSGFRNGNYDSSTGAYNPSGNGISTERIPVQSGQAYHLTGIGSGQTIRILYWNNSSYVTSETKTTHTAGDTITPQGNYLAIQTSSTASYTNPQLEKGSTATEYVEYKQPVKKTSIGVKEDTTFYANDFKCKNLFAGIMYNGIINQSGAYITNNARITNTTANGFFLPQGTYTLSIADLDACTIVIKNASGTVIQDLADSWKTLPFTFTTIQDGYICFSAKKNNDATLNPNDYAPQLEVGSEATSYTPYKNFDNTPIITQLLSDTTLTASTSYALSDAITNYKYIMLVLTSGGSFENANRQYIPVEQIQGFSNLYRCALSVFQSTSVYMFADMYFADATHIYCNTVTRGTTGWAGHLKVYGIK